MCVFNVDICLYVCMCLLVFVNLTQTEETWAEGPSIEELLPLYWPLDMSVGGF